MNEGSLDIHQPAAKRIRLEETEYTKSNSTGDESKETQESSTDKKSIEETKCVNFISPEELDKLREFKVLDEVKSNDDDSDDEDSDSSDGKSEDFPEEEIEKMLEEGLPDELKGAPKPKEKPYVTRTKIVLEEKGVNHFEVLPLDWVMVRHYSGMPIYMQRNTRVCTLSKPYFLGKGNTRRHEIPISAIPCLSYRKALEEEEKEKEIDKRIQEKIKNGTWNDSVNNHQKNIESCKNVKQPNSITENVILAGKQSSPTISIQTNKPKCPFSHETKTDIALNFVDDKDIDENRNNEICVVDNKKNCVAADENKLAISDISVNNNGKHENNISKDDDVSGSNENNIKKNDGDSNKNDGNTSVIRAEDNGSDNDDGGIPANRKPVVLPGGLIMPPPKVETVSTSWKTQHLSHEQIFEYCKKLFKFKTVNIMHFKRWADRRKYTKARKTLQCPMLPEGTKLITIPAQPGGEGTGKAGKHDWVMNMNGRSYLSVFHEYVRRALQKQPVYEFKQLENASSPYQATVYIGGMQYGVGLGSSKRQAKSAAARASIHILIPEMKDDLDRAEPDFSFFDYVGIEDPRITEFCTATCEPSPHAILRTCLLRNFGAGDRHINTEIKKLEYQKIELTMKVGKHTATVICKNKKTAKQRASQSILQALHPHVRSWGSLLRLYGSRSVKSCKEKKLEEQQITLLQDKARHNEPNYAVLDKLRSEMRKLGERDGAVVPIGTLMVHDHLPTHSGSNLNNVDL